MKKRLISLAVIIAIVTGITSCQKNMAPEKQASPIKQSRIWFDRQFDASLAIKDKQLTGGDKYPLWQMAKQYDYKGLSIVEVPLVFKNRPIYGVKTSEGNFSLPANASVSKLMIARNGAGGYRAAIVDMVADKAFYQAGGEVSQLSLNHIPQSFNGYILSRSWYGEPQVGYRLEGGHVKQRIKPRKATAQAATTDDTEMKDAIAGGGIPFGILCEGCDFYLNAGDVASYPICATVAMACGQEMWDTDYTDPCSIEMGNIFGCPCEYGVINYDNCGFGTGGEGQNGVIVNSPDFNLDGLSQICKSSFIFKKHLEPTGGVGGWQVAGTIDIHMNIVDFVTRRAVRLTLPTMYFGLPVIRANGDYYSTAYAAEIAAKAVEAAEVEVMNRYHALGGTLDVVGMTLYFRERINAHMQAKSGSATLTPGSNITVTEYGTATYPWPIIGC